MPDEKRGYRGGGGKRGRTFYGSSYDRPTHRMGGGRDDNQSFRGSRSSLGTQRSFRDRGSQYSYGENQRSYYNKDRHTSSHREYYSRRRSRSSSPEIDRKYKRRCLEDKVDNLATIVESLAKTVQSSLPNAPSGSIVPVKTSKERKPERTPSKNQDFTELAKTIACMTRIKIHKQQWDEDESLNHPHSFVSKVEDCFTSLNFPLHDTVLQEKLQKIQQDTIANISKAVSEHLDYCMHRETSYIKTLDNTDLAGAKRLGFIYARQHLPTTVSSKLIKLQIKEVADEIYPKPTLVLQDMDLVSAEMESSLLEGPISLQDSLMSDSEEALLRDAPLHEPEPQQPSKPLWSSEAKETPPTSPADRVFVYTGNKTKWKLSPSGTCDTLIIGDSNLKSAKHVPPGCEIHCFPGVKLQHAVSAIQRLRVDRQYDIVIQVGINHRFDTMETITHQINELATLHRDSPSVRRLFAVQLSVAETLPAQQLRNVEAFNLKLLSVLGPERCIYPLHPKSIFINKTDIHGIHHTIPTIRRITTSISNFLSTNPFNDQSHQ